MEKGNDPVALADPSTTEWTAGEKLPLESPMPTGVGGLAGLASETQARTREVDPRLEQGVQRVASPTSAGIPGVQFGTPDVSGQSDDATPVAPAQPSGPSLPDAPARPDDNQDQRARELAYQAVVDHYCITGDPGNPDRNWSEANETIDPNGDVFVALTHDSTTSSGHQTKIKVICIQSHSTSDPNARRRDCPDPILDPATTARMRALYEQWHDPSLDDQTPEFEYAAVLVGPNGAVGGPKITAAS
jgi:hypothetical protein